MSAAGISSDSTDRKAVKVENVDDIEVKPVEAIMVENVDDIEVKPVEAIMVGKSEAKGGNPAIEVNLIWLTFFVELSN